jgi:hypothetical protein
MADEYPDFQNFDLQGRANRLRSRIIALGRELAEKTTRHRIRRWDGFPESVGRARTCPVHAVLGCGLS